MQLPLAAKTRLAPTAQWLPIALPYPQRSVQVVLACGGGQFDVTANSVIAALKPLTISIGISAPMRSALASGSDAELKFVDRDLDRVIGVLLLRQVDSWGVAGSVLALFEVRRGRHRCAGWPRRTFDRWMYRRAARKSTRPDAFSLAAQIVEQTMIFYLCPRPVFLVSVDDGQHSNVFPMDLVGPAGSDHFSLALRSTSPSVATIKSERKVALSAIAAADCRIAYQLGAHHKRLTIDRDALPFKLCRSTLFSLPVPANALRVREVEILDFRAIGSHTMFLGRVACDERGVDGTQLFHTCGIYQQWRIRHKRPFQSPAA
jgi:flavin reductase (DIM6/NTAB) family NADH-FMN oxidoreductase RutF